MKTLTISLLAAALFAFTGDSAQAIPGRQDQGAAAHYTRSNDGVQKRRYYYGRPVYRNDGYRYYGYRPYYREYYYRPYVRPYSYYSGPGYYFGTGAYRYYPQPYPYYYYP